MVRAVGVVEPIVDGGIWVAAQTPVGERVGAEVENAEAGRVEGARMPVGLRRVM